MRVHGDKKIKRRTNIEEKNNYSDYKRELSEDFYHICGYCGKPESVTTNGFEPDHFVPCRIAPERKCDYSNLVNSCYTCNHKKLGKWPTEDKNILNDGKVGFVDPTSEEFDQHLRRQDDGSIIGISSVGKYMCNDVFKFNLRPIHEIWLCSEIILKKEILQQRVGKLSESEKNKYIELDIKLEQLKQVLFDKRE